jgi:serine phosphatase RsbU (regulator of sigma subunit)
MVSTDLAFAGRTAEAPALDYTIWTMVRCFDGSAACGDVIVTGRLPDRRIALVVVDLIGGGASRAARAASVADDVLTMLLLGHSPGFATHDADAALQRGGWIDDLPPLATIFAAVGCPSDGKLTYASAAHETAMLLAPDGTHRHLRTTGPVAGLFESPLFGEVAVPFAHGESLVVVTDGVTDTHSGERPFFGSRGTVHTAARALRAGADPAEALIAAAQWNGVIANDAAALVVQHGMDIARASPLRTFSETRGTLGA